MHQTYKYTTLMWKSAKTRQNAPKRAKTRQNAPKRATRHAPRATRRSARPVPQVVPLAWFGSTDEHTSKFPNKCGCESIGTARFYRVVSKNLRT